MRGSGVALVLSTAVAALALAACCGGGGGVTGVRADPIHMLAVGSCNKHTDAHQPIFDSARQVGAEGWVWLGDVVYGDIRTFPLMWSPAPVPEKQARYDALKYRPDYAALRASMPVYGIYDDHDFGINNGGRDYADRHIAMQLFLDFLDEPQGSARRRQHGVYAAYTLGEGRNKVKLVLLDNRFNRDPTDTGRSGAGDMLGEEQWQWLERELTNSDAAVHLIANGIQVLPREKPIQEKWAEFPRSRTRLLELLARKRVPGVVLLSGDIHYAELLRSECTPLAYPLWEMATSGMSHSCESQVPFGLCRAATEYVMTDSHRVASYLDFNFLTIEFDWHARTLTLSVRRPDASVALSQTLSLAEMQPAPEGTPLPAGWDTHPLHCPPVAEWRLYKEEVFVVAGRALAVVLLLLGVLVARCCGCCSCGSGKHDTAADRARQRRAQRLDESKSD